MSREYDVCLTDEVGLWHIAKILRYTDRVLAKRALILSHIW